MALFQKSVLKSQLEKLDEDLIQQSWETYKSYFLDASKQKIIFEKKEEELQYEFLLQLFDKSLGYDIGVGNQNLFVEQKNQADSKKADGAIKINGEIVCVIELKSTKTKNLKDVETQAFGYKVSHPNCKYVVTSNFNKLRFYIDNTTEFEEFDLFNLTVDRFKLLWLCLSYDSISSNKPLSINKESLVNEEKITKQLYKDYSEDKRINLNYALGVLNSKLTDFFYWTLNPEKGEAMAEVKAFHLGMLILPIPNNDIQNFISEKVEVLLKRNTNKTKLNHKFTKYLQSQFSIEKLPKKLQNWHELEFGDFIKELNKVIKKAGGEKLSKMDEMEWMEVFETNKSEAQTLKAEIDKTDTEIDTMVYELYGLTKEEIEIVENS